MLTGHQGDMGELDGNGNGTDLVSEAIGVITQHIRAHELGPGDRLLSESKFAVDMNVSRSVVREAFRSLAAMRLINLSAGKRATIAEIDHGAMSLMFEHAVLTEQISIQQIYDARRANETRSVTLASLRRTDEEAQIIRTHAGRMMEYIDEPDKVMEHDLAFHQAIAEAARNPVFSLIVGAFKGVTRQSWPIGWSIRRRREQRVFMVQTHIDIADAIAIGDPEQAATLMKVHFDNSTKVLLDAGLA